MIKQRLSWIAGLLVALAITGGLWSPGLTVNAQGTNLLVNGSLERPYYGQDVGTRTAPQGWSMWVGAGNPEAYPHNDKVNVREGDVSWNMKQGYVAFTAAGYQRVAVTKGDNLRASAYGWVYTCNDTATSCIIQEAPYRRSDTSAGATLKVGVDPTGGTDPNSAAVIWSAPAAPYDQWIEMSVVVEAQADAVTVFLWASQTKGLALNNVYWDSASLVNTDETPTAPGSTAVPTPPAEVPFVVPQNVRPDGSIVHVVQAGDTLSSIAYAYNADYGTTVESIAALNDNLQPNTRFLQLGQEIMILPPGSVDPTTGKLIPESQRVSPTPGTSVAATPTGSTQASATEQVIAQVPTATAQPTVTEIPPTATTGAIQSTSALPRPGEAVAAATTAEPTEAPTTAPVEQPTEQAAAPTQAPTAIAEAASGLSASNGTLCVLVYQDANQNLAHDADEGSITGSQITLAQPGSAETDYAYDESGPMCLDLLPGSYTVSAILPQNYGLTTAGSAVVTLASGRQVSVAFGGAEGYAPPVAPTANTEQATEESVETGAVAPMVEVVVDSKDENKSTLDRLYDNSGLYVLGLAGVIVVSSALLFVIVRRFTR